MHDDHSELTSPIDNFIDDVARAATAAPVPHSLRSAVRRRIDLPAGRWRVPLRVAVATVAVVIAVGWWEMGHLKVAPTNTESQAAHTSGRDDSVNVGAGFSRPANADVPRLTVAPIQQPLPLALDEIDVAPILLE